MAFFEWSDSFDVGVAKLNRQHQRLIGMINKLHEAVQQGRDSNTQKSAVSELTTMASVLEKLIDYSKYHFATEEHYMVEYAYPAYDEHKREHGRFVERIGTFKRDFDEGRALLSTEIMQFLQQWWTEHILAVDKQYRPLFNEKGLR